MARQKQFRVGEVTEVIVPSLDVSRVFAATLRCRTRDDEGRDYYIHITADQIAALTGGEVDSVDQPEVEDFAAEVNARLDELAEAIKALRIA